MLWQTSTERQYIARNDLKTSQVTAPFPISVGPSQDWDGADGPWSSFPIQVGTPSQVVKVFVGTGAFEQIVILPQGCSTSDNANCGTSRGGLFEINQSTTWQSNTYSSPKALYNVEVEKRLGYSEGGLFGFDNITLGWPGAGGPLITNQSLGGIASKNFYLGLLGLNPRPKNFTTFNQPVSSLVQNLRSKNLIPSLSWSYTAGNQYRLNQVFGSLILGGYDVSKFNPNTVNWSFDPEDLIDISVNVDRIVSTSSQKNLLPSSIKIYMDSSVPQIWLPIETCQLFEDEFGIIWNDILDLYLVNDTQHTLLISQNSSIVFTLSSSTSAGTVDITLPYAAFDLTLNAPLVANPPIRYFPLKRAENSTQYTLGRTFFQEAYLTADYERKNFSISQCNWDFKAQSKIVAILPPDFTSVGNGTIVDPNPPSVLSLGAIIGIAITGLVMLAIASLIFYIVVIKPRQKRRQQSSLQPNIHGQTSPQTTHEFIKAELDGNPYNSRPIKDTRQELDTDYVSPVPKFDTQVAEIDGIASSTISKGHVEGDGKEIQIYEMPAREEVAAEIGDTSLQDIRTGR